MDFGFGIPQRGPLASVDNVETVAREGEALGFAYAFVSDHVVVARSIASIYPYSETGEFPGSGGDYMEQLTTAAFIAGMTSRVRILTSVMVVPHRPAVLAAKQLATIDVLSRGRLTVGCGAGWMQEEFEAIGAPPFAERGRVTDEHIAAFKALWTQDDPVFEGAYSRFRNVIFLPKPVQAPHPPIWIGGESGPAMRRAARIGDGWYPFGSNPKFPLDTLERFKAALGRLAGYARDAGRDPASIDLAYNIPWHNEAAQGSGNDRRLFTGTPQQRADDLMRLQDLGVRHAFPSFVAASLDETLTRMRRFAEEVTPLVR